MMIFVLVSVMISILLFNASHPLALLILILIQTVNMCLMMWAYLKISWFSYILFLIFIGGLMVLFMYITSLASNEKFENSFEQFSKNYTLIVLGLMTAIMIMYMMNYSTSMNILILNQNMLLFSSPMNFLVLVIMSYLLITLVVAVKITSKFEGPLRSTIKKS